MRPAMAIGAGDRKGRVYVNDDHDVNDNDGETPSIMRPIAVNTWRRIAYAHIDCHNIQRAPMKYHHNHRR